MTAVSTLWSCSKENEGGDTSKGKILEVNVSDDQWSYISLETGKVIGTSTLGDAEADAQWKSRTDWDIAVCGDMIRTNSGTSGDGKGGIALSPSAYDALDEAPASGYSTDEKNVEVPVSNEDEVQ